MLTLPKINTTYPSRYSPSLYFSSTNYSKYLTYLLQKFRDDFQTPSKGFHHLRGPSQQIYFIPKKYLQTWPVYRTNPPKLPKLNEHNFVSLHTSRNASIFPLNKLTMLFTGVRNSGLNSFQPGGHDTTQLDKQMTNDIKDTSHLGQSSQNKRQGLTSSQRSLRRRRPKDGL